MRKTYTLTVAVPFRIYTGFPILRLIEPRLRRHYRV